MQKAELLPKEESKKSIFRRKYAAQILHKVAENLILDDAAKHVNFGNDKEFIKFADELHKRILLSDLDVVKKLKLEKEREVIGYANNIIDAYVGGSVEKKEMKKRAKLIIKERLKTAGEDGIIIFFSPSNPPQQGYCGFSTQKDKTSLYFRSTAEKLEIGFHIERVSGTGKKKDKGRKPIYTSEIPQFG